MAPSTNCGMPQLPLATTTASGAAAVMPRMLSASPAGPTPQLAPIAAGAGARVVANAAKPAGVRPIMVQALVSKVMVTTTGRPVRAAPATAAATSFGADLVSIHRARKSGV